MSLSVRACCHCEQERKFLEQQQESSESALLHLADQHRTAVAQLEHESLQLKHQLLRGLCDTLTNHKDGQHSQY